MTGDTVNFADRMRAEARKTDSIPWPFGQGMVREGLEEDLQAGLEAFAQLWFLELTDETDLPRQFYGLVELMEKLNIAYVELDEEEDEEVGV
jgi:hypothetical protein